MEKESVKKFDLEAAFKALDEIEIPQTKGIRANRVDLKERFNRKSAHETLIEDYYDVSSNEDLEEAQEERDAEVAQAKLARIEKIVDLDADTADDLLPSYVGKVIIQCPQCMTLFYKNPEDIEHSDENPDVVNINEVCQHCGNASGYTLIGKVDSVSEEEADKYETAEGGEENELDLDFEEPTEEVDAEGTGEGAEEMSDEEFDELNLELEEIPEEEEAKESLNLSKEAQSENETEHKSENLTLNEEATDESLNNSEVQKEAEEGSELKTENESENLTLNEDVDKDLDKKLKEHNDYIAYLQQMIKQEEEALKKTDNEEVKAAIQRCLDAFNADLEEALPDALKSVPEVAVDELADSEPVEEAPAEEPVVEEEPKEDTPVEEQLTEDAAEEEPAEDNEVNYVDYKHSYCHILAPKLRGLHYLVFQKGIEAGKLIGYIKKLLKDPLVRWTDKEQEFKKNLEAKTDPKDIYNYVKNSIEKAKTLKVKVDENGELVEGLNEGFEGCLYEVLTESLNEAKYDVEIDSEVTHRAFGIDANSEDEAADKARAKFANNEADEVDGSETDVRVDKYDESLKEAADPSDEILAIIDSWDFDDPKTKPAPAEDPANTPVVKEPVPANNNEAADAIDDIMATWESLEEGLSEEKLAEFKANDFFKDLKDVDIKKIIRIYKEDTEVSDDELVAEDVADYILSGTVGGFIFANVEKLTNTCICALAKKDPYFIEALKKYYNNPVNSDEELVEIVFSVKGQALEDTVEELDEIYHNLTKNIKEELTEGAEDHLDTLLDSPEFKKPISDEEVLGYFEGYKGTPAERTTHLEYTDDDPTDGKAVLPDNIEKQLTENIKDDADAHRPCWDIEFVGAGEGKFFNNEEEARAAFKALRIPEDIPANTGDVILWYLNPDKNNYDADIKLDYIRNPLNKSKEELEALGILENLTEGEECKDGKCEDDLQPAIDARKGPVKVEKPLEECGEKPLKEEDEIPAEEEAPVEEPVEEPVIDEPVIPENSEEVSFTTDEVKEVATNVAQALATPVEDEEEAEKQAEEIAEVVDEKVDAAIEEKVEEANEGEAEEEAEEPEFSEDDIDDLDECSLNKHIDEYLQEVYSNVKSYETTNCELKEGKLIVEGKISFKSGKEKLTMFEFLPAYGEGKLFFEGYNKDFSDEKAFTLNCSINESKTLITESFGYKYKINENLVEGLK